MSLVVRLKTGREPQVRAALSGDGTNSRRWEDGTVGVTSHGFDTETGKVLNYLEIRGSRERVKALALKLLEHV